MSKSYYMQCKDLGLTSHTTSTKLRIVQNRRLHNNSWLTSLPLWCELNQLTCVMSSETRHIFKQGLHLHDDHLIFPHHVPFMLMPSKPVYMLPTNLKMSLILQSLDFTELSPLMLWMLLITGWWHENIPFGMPLLLHYSFGQRTSTQSPLA